MLTSQLYAPNGKFITYGPLGDLGNLGGLFSSIASGVSSVGGAIKSSASAVSSATAAAGAAASIVGKTAYQAGAQAANVVATVGKYTCGVVNNSSVQTGAKLAAEYGQYIPKYGQAAQGAGYAVQGAGALCNMAYPPKAPATQPQSTQPREHRTTPTFAVLKPVAMTAVKPAAPAAPAPAARPTYPPGAYQFYEPRIKQWRLVVPRGGVASGLGAPPIAPPGLVKRQRYTVGLYRRVVTAERPYLAAYTQGELGQAGDQIVADSPTPHEGVPQKTTDEGRAGTRTQPWYKTYKLWLAIGAVGLAGAGTTYAVVRRRRRTQ